MITFFSEQIEWECSHKTQIKKWLMSAITHYEKKTGDINLIFSSDDYVLQVNRDYLKHDYYTDIITFNYNKGLKISGDLFISIDRVRENAEALGVKFFDELLRVSVHGVLHLLDFDDKVDDDEAEMRKTEDFWIARFHELYPNLKIKE